MSEAASRLDLRPDYWAIVRGVLQRHVPDRKVLAFGSRANWTAKEYSDLDLAILGDEPLFLDTTSALAEGLAESDLPFKVDLVDWARIDETFRDIIRRDGVAVQVPTEDSAANFPARQSPANCGKSGMPSEWRENTLGSLLLFSNGKSSPERSDSLPYPVYGSNGIIGFSDETNAPPKTTVIGRVGSYCGSLHYSDKICWVTDNAIRANAANGNDAKFLFYLLQTLRLNDRKAGSGQPLLNQTILSSIPVVVPHPVEQRAIAHILGTLDDKIELNRRMNATLEAMARALFKDWFVDFGPTRTKIEGRDPYLAPEIWDLFPDKLDDGRKPEGWEYGRLADIADSPSRGVRPSEVSKDTPYIGLEHMPRRSVALTEWEGAGKVTSNKYVFKRGEFLFGKLRPYFHKVGIAPIDGICSTDIVVIAPRAPHWNSLTLACISTDDFVDYTNTTSTGTKMPRTSWKTMGQYELCFSTVQVAQAFEGSIGLLTTRIVSNIRECKALSQSRDLLLPKLMSGEIRVGDTDKIVQEST